MASTTLIAATLSARGQDATWLGVSFSYENPAAWAPPIVPTGTAFFPNPPVGFLTNFLIGVPQSVGGWTFDPGPLAYSISNFGGFTFNGAGISNVGAPVDIFNGSDLVFTSSSTAGNATINNFALLLFNTSSTAGNATIDNSQLLAFNDASTAGSATIANSSLVIFFSSSTAGDATINNSQLLVFNDASTAGSALITNSVSGTVTFTGASSANAATITNDGALNFNATSSAGSALVTNNAGAVLNFSNTSTAGNATITNNALTMSFLDSSTAGSAAITNNGTLNFTDTSTAGGATITTNAGGATRFFISSTGGDARFITNLGGVFDMSGLATAGMTTGSIEGPGSYILGAKALSVGSNNLSTAVSGVISGNLGSLTKIGTGTLTLSGTNTYTGATTVNAGTLLVNGSIASSSDLTVNASAVVGGTGTLPTTTINGGTLSPGTAIGTIAVNGNLTFNAGSTYLVEVSPTTADRTNVSGTATLAGTVQAVFQPGSYLSKSYTILSAAGGRSGQFDSLVSAGANVNASLSYTPTDVLLNLTAALGVANQGLPGNQQAVAGAINNAFNNGTPLPPGFATLFGLSGGALSNALSQLSGEVATGAVLSATQMMNAFLSLTLNPYGGSPEGNPGALGYARAFGATEANALPRGAADAYAADMPVKAPPASMGVAAGRWSVWGQGYGGYNKTDGDAVVGSHDTTSRTYGFAAGADYRVSPNTIIGFALGGGELNWSLAQGLGSGKSDVFQAGVYASHRVGAAYVSGALAYAWYDMSTDRTVTVAGTDVLRASFDAHNVGARIEAGYRIATPWAGVTPYGAAQVQRFRTPGYSEAAATGSNTFALSYNSNSTTASRFELGSWFDHLFAYNNGNAILLRGRVAWAHDEGNNGAIGAVFQTLPGAGFVVNGAAPPHDLALVSAGAELRLVNNVSVGARFDGEFSDRAQTYSGTGTVRYRW